MPWFTYDMWLVWFCVKLGLLNPDEPLFPYHKGVVHFDSDCTMVSSRTPVLISANSLFDTQHTQCDNACYWVDVEDFPDDTHSMVVMLSGARLAFHAKQRVDSTPPTLDVVAAFTGRVLWFLNSTLPADLKFRELMLSEQQFMSQHLASALPFVKEELFDLWADQSFQTDMYSRLYLKSAQKAGFDFTDFEQLCQRIWDNVWLFVPTDFVSSSDSYNDSREYALALASKKIHVPGGLLVQVPLLVLFKKHITGSCIISTADEVSVQEFRFLQNHPFNAVGEKTSCDLLQAFRSAVAVG